MTAALEIKDAHDKDAWKPLCSNVFPSCSSHARTRHIRFSFCLVLLLRNGKPTTAATLKQHPG